MTVTISDPNALPEGTVFVVENLTDKEYKESKALIIEQLCPEANEQELALAEESMKDLVLYDMHFEVDGTEVEPVNAKISVEIENKKITAPKSVDSEWNEDELLTIYNEREPITRVQQKRISKTTRRTVRTGDNTPIELLLLLCGTAIIITGAVFWKKKRTN